MLVLSRRPGSAIVINHVVRVTVEAVADDDVCFAVDGPAGTTVERIEDREVARQLRSSGRELDRSRMHVLSRREPPELVIGGSVRIAVLGVSGDIVRIGIEAPQNIEIHREEVYREIQEANPAAVSNRTPAWPH